VPPDRLVRSATASGNPMPAVAQPEVRVKPRLRGVFHQYAFFVSLVSGTLLVLLATVGASVVAGGLKAPGYRIGDGAPPSGRTRILTASPSGAVRVVNARSTSPSQNRCVTSGAGSRIPSL
jgi:hypothetical protein